MHNLSLRTAILESNCMESGSRAQTITGAHSQASFARIGSATKTFHERENTMLIDEAWTLWLGLLSIFSLHILSRTILLPSSTSTKLSILPASNVRHWCVQSKMEVGADFLRGTQSQKRVGSFLSESCLAPVLLKTVPSLSFLVQLAGGWSRCCRAAIRSWCPIFPRRGSFTCQLHADGVVLPADSVLNFQDALDAVSGWGRKYRFTYFISPTKSEILVFGPRSHVPSCAVTVAGTLSLVVDGVVLTHFSLGSVMYGISFQVESPIRPTCRLVLLGSSPNALRSLSTLCASQHLREVRVVPQFDSCRSTDGRCSAQVGSPSSRSAFGLTKRCGFPQTCLARRPSPLRRATIVPLLGALSPCPTVNAAFARANLPYCPLHPRFMSVPLRPSLQFLGCSPPHDVRH